MPEAELTGDRAHATRALSQRQRGPSAFFYASHCDGVHLNTSNCLSNHPTSRQQQWGQVLFCACR